MISYASDSRRASTPDAPGYAKFDLLFVEKLLKKRKLIDRVIPYESSPASVTQRVRARRRLLPSTTGVWLSSWRDSDPGSVEERIRSHVRSLVEG